MKKGFTLIEVLAVVMIIGILSAIALPQYQKAVEKAKVTEAQTTLKALYDSSERLASEFGYDDYVALANDSSFTNGKKVGIGRLDMFGDSLGTGRSLENGGIKYTDQLYSPNFNYKLVVGGHYLGAKMTAATAYPGTLILFDRNNQELYCQPGTAGSEVCDVFGLDAVSGTTF